MMLLTAAAYAAVWLSDVT